MRCPKLAICREPLVELYEWLGPDAVQAALRVCAHVDEACLPEDSEMLGNGRLADAEAVDELADSSLAVTEEIEDREPAGLGEDL